MSQGEGEMGHLDDQQEEAETSTEDGAAARGEYDPAQGSPDSGGHPVGETYPEEAVTYEEPADDPVGEEAD